MVKLSIPSSIFLLLLITHEICHADEPSGYFRIGHGFGTFIFDNNKMFDYYSADRRFPELVICISGGAKGDVIDDNKAFQLDISLVNIDFTVPLIRENRDYSYAIRSSLVGLGFDLGNDYGGLLFKIEPISIGGLVGSMDLSGMSGTYWTPTAAMGFRAGKNNKYIIVEIKTSLWIGKYADSFGCRWASVGPGNKLVQ